MTIFGPNMVLDDAISRQSLEIVLTHTQQVAVDLTIMGANVGRSKPGHAALSLR